MAAISGETVTTGAAASAAGVVAAAAAEAVAIGLTAETDGASPLLLWNTLSAKVKTSV